MPDSEYNRAFPDDDQGAPRASGMSGSAKVLWILAGLGGVVALVCCGGAGFFYYKAREMVTDDPVKIRAATAEIVDIEVPPDLHPMGSMNMLGMMQFVFYSPPDKDPKSGMLMIASFSDKLGGNNPQQQQMQMRQQMQAQSGGGMDLRGIKTETRAFEVRGAKTEFEFIEAEERTSKAKYREVIGTFSGKTGTTMLLFTVPEDKYDEAAVVKMIESIH